METSIYSIVKYELLNRISHDVHNKARDKSFATRIYWSVGLKDHPDCVMTFLKARREFDLLLAGSILKPEKYNSEYEATIGLLPYNFIINGFLVVNDGIMDEKTLTQTALRLAKEIAKFKQHTLPTPYLIIFVKNLPPDRSLYTGKDLFTYKIHSPEEAKKYLSVVDYKNEEFYDLQKNYFGVYTNFFLPNDKNQYSLSLKLKDTSLKIAKKNEWDDSVAKELLEKLASQISPYNEGIEHLTLMPFIEAVVSADPSPKMPDLKNRKFDEIINCYSGEI